MARALLSDGDRFTHEGREFRVDFERDEDMGAPWKEHDGHGVVSEWTRRSKAPGERVLSEDRGSYRYYDVRASLRLALRDGWGTEGDEGLTKRAKAAKAVDADFAHLARWCRDEWCWVVAVVTDLATGEKEAVGGIESDSDEYLTETAYELAGELAGRLNEVDAVVTTRKALAARLTTAPHHWDTLTAYERDVIIGALRGDKETK